MFLLKRSDKTKGQLVPQVAQPVLERTEGGKSLVPLKGQVHYFGHLGLFTVLIPCF